MESLRYLIDSNILIYHFAGEIPVQEQDRIKAIFKDSFNISIITKIEFLGWKRHTESGFKEAQEFLQESGVIYIDDEIASRTIELRKNHSIKLPDALIAATALKENYILVTRNESDFKNLGLGIYNPFRVIGGESEKTADWDMGL